MKPRLKRLLLAIICIILVVIGGFYILNRPENKGGKQEMLQISNVVSKLAILPKGEEPTLATVTDKAKLTDPFLKANAESGDKILVYIQAKRVYIYRPSAKRLVNIGPLEVDASAAQVRGSRMLLWQGNGSATDTQKLKDVVAQNYPSAIVSSAIGKSKRQDYPKTIIIDLTEGDKYDLVTNMMRDLGAERGILPMGESKPDNVDVLIITGLSK